MEIRRYSHGLFSLISKLHLIEAELVKISLLYYRSKRRLQGPINRVVEESEKKKEYQLLEDREYDHQKERNPKIKQVQKCLNKKENVTPRSEYAFD